MTVQMRTASHSKGRGTTTVSVSTPSGSVVRNDSDVAGDALKGLEAELEELASSWKNGARFLWPSTL